MPRSPPGSGPWRRAYPNSIVATSSPVGCRTPLKALIGEIKGLGSRILNPGPDHVLWWLPTFIGNILPWWKVILSSLSSPHLEMPSVRDGLGTTQGRMQVRLQSSDHRRFGICRERRLTRWATARLVARRRVWDIAQVATLGTQPPGIWSWASIRCNSLCTNLCESARIMTPLPVRVPRTSVSREGSRDL
jgi:hypothetical protein